MAVRREIARWLSFEDALDRVRFLEGELNISFSSGEARGTNLYVACHIGVLQLY